MQGGACSWRFGRGAGSVVESGTATGSAAACATTLGGHAEAKAGILVAAPMVTVTQADFVGFLRPAPTGTAAQDNLHKALRFLGIAILAGLALSILRALTIGFADLRHLPEMVAGVLLAALITAAAVYWITWIRAHLGAGHPQLSTHLLVLGILAVVVGGLGVLGSFGWLGGAAWLFSGNLTVALLEALATVVSVAELAFGIWILVERTKL